MRAYRPYSVLLILAASAFALLSFTACEESGNTGPDIPPPEPIHAEHSFGKLTVFADIADGPSNNMIAVGYRDSLGNGNREPMIAVLDFLARLRYKHIIQDDRIASVDVVKYDPLSTSYIAVACGKTTAPTLYRIFPDDTVIVGSVVPFEGNTVYPSELMVEKDGNMIISGWVESGNINKAFVVKIATSGEMVWARYFEEAGVSVKATDLIEDDSGYVVPVSYTPEGGGQASHSRIVLLDRNGTNKRTVEVAVPGLKIEEIALKTRAYRYYDWDDDSGYTIAGEIYSITSMFESGYIGIVNPAGEQIWKGDLGNDSLFRPVSMLSQSSSYGSSYTVAGNIEGQKAVFGMHTWIKNYRYDHGRLQSDNKNTRFINYRGARGNRYAVELSRYTTDAMNGLIEGVAVVQQYL